MNKFEIRTQRAQSSGADPDSGAITSPEYGFGPERLPVIDQRRPAGKYRYSHSVKPVTDRLKSEEPAIDLRGPGDLPLLFTIYGRQRSRENRIGPRFDLYETNRAAVESYQVDLSRDLRPVSVPPNRRGEIAADHLETPAPQVFSRKAFSLGAKGACGRFVLLCILEESQPCCGHKKKRITQMKNQLFLIICATSLFVTAACAQAPEKEPGDVPVRHFEKAETHSVSPADMPQPFASESARRSSRQVSRPEGAVLNVPGGFVVNTFAEGIFRNPRMAVEAPNGDVFVSDSFANRIVVLRDKDRDGRSDENAVFTEEVTQPFGMAFRDGWFYVANTDSVVRFRYRDGQMRAEAAPEKIIDLPGRGYRQHWTRNLIFSPDGAKLYVTVGSESNVSVEPDPRRAAISVYDTKNWEHSIFASGLRNPVGVDFNPATGELWTAVNERDGLGDDLVPDYVTSVKEGGFYGWPYVYIGKNVDPRRKDDVKPEHLENVIVPDVLVTSHSAALGIVFYDGKMFPEEYRGDAFVAFHGSWNRQRLTGYKIVRIRFDDSGKLMGNEYEDFVTGWLPDPASTDVWGRPVGLAVLSDGSMLITDDGANKIWRISYAGGKK